MGDDEIPTTQATLCSGFGPVLSTAIAARRCVSPVLEKNELVFDFHAKHLKSVNELRNKAAHGVIFGEIEHSGLAEGSEKAQHSALGALERFQAWFNNPQPLKHVPRST